MQNNDISEEIIFKIITIGDGKVGKTSIIKRYIENKFSEEYIKTLGMSNSKKSIVLKNGKKIFLNLIDTAGQEEFRSLNKQYVKNIDGVLFVFDLSRLETFRNIKMWMDFFNNNYIGKDNIPKYLIGNKKDLNKEIDQERIDVFLEENNDFYHKYKATSAKEEDNQINELFQEMGELLYKVNKKYMNKKSKNIKLTSLSDSQKKVCVIAKCIV